MLREAIDFIIAYIWYRSRRFLLFIVLPCVVLLLLL
jgi:hypothetical protein